MKKLFGTSALSFCFCTILFAQDQVSIKKDLAYFETPMAVSLKKNTRKKAITKITDPQLRQVAASLLNKQYDTKYRMASYSAWLTPTTLGQELMIGDGYSKYENITGVYLPEGKQLVLVSNIAEGKQVKLVIPNWNRRAPEGIKPTEDPAGWGIISQDFVLQNGINILDVKNSGGLAYIDYFSDNPATENKIEVHFPAAAVNGYFDLSVNNNDDWNKLVDNAVYPVIDARGKHIQIAYPAADCKKYAYGKGVELIKNYDSLVHLQHMLLGLVKYKKEPANHILARVNYNYYMFRDGDGVAYMGTNPGNAMPLVVDPSRVVKGDPCWGFSHEVGHVHQLRPFVNWGGLGEVSNNLFSVYGTTSFGNSNRISEQKNYQKSKDSIIARGICYLQDKDVFNRLVPFWQLQLYFAGVGGNKDFYPDLFEAFRQQGANDRKANGKDIHDGGWGSRGSNPAIYQLNFVKTVCEVGKVDLTDFFDKYGFFYVGKFQFDDYGDYSYELTQQMVDDCKNAVKALNLPKPTIDLTTLED